MAVVRGNVPVINTNVKYLIAVEYLNKKQEICPNYCVRISCKSSSHPKGILKKHLLNLLTCPSQEKALTHQQAV